MANHFKFVLVLVCTAVAGALVALAALFFLVAGGHGWNATAVSTTTVILGPLGVMAWFFREMRAGKQIALVTVISNVLADLAFVVITLREGFEYVEDAWRHLPILIVVWAAAWLCLQLPPALALRTYPTVSRSSK